MKVTKHGKKFKDDNVNTEEFRCYNCQCEFRAKPDEYYTDYNSWNQSGIGSITYSSTAEDTLVCSCPECHKICKKTKYRTNYVPYTVTCNGTSASNAVDTTTTVDVKLK